MSHALRAINLGLFLLAAGQRLAAAQALPTRSLELRPSAFAGVTAVETGLNGGRNLSLTGGVDLGFLPGHTVQPALEYRGTFAIDKGRTDSQKNNLGGLKLSTHVWRAHPYVNFLYGRCEINYGAGFEVPGKPIYYTFSSSNVLSPGGGVDLDLNPFVALKLDIQLQRYNTPVSPTAPLYATAATVAIEYRFHLGRR